MKKVNLQFIVPFVLGLIIAIGGLGLLATSLHYDFGMGERVILILFIGFIVAVFGIMIAIIGYSMKKKGVKTNHWNASFDTNGQIVSLKEKATGEEVTFHVSDIKDIVKQSNKHMLNAVVSLKDESKITLYNLNQEKYDQIAQLKR